MLPYVSNLIQQFNGNVPSEEVQKMRIFLQKRGDRRVQELMYNGIPEKTAKTIVNNAINTSMRDLNNTNSHN